MSYYGSQGDKYAAAAKACFNKRSGIESMWQEIADNFAPQRSDFIGSRAFGQEYADHLVDSYPIIACRELSDAIGATLRAGKWFELYADEKLDHRGEQWMDKRAEDMRVVMSDNRSGFARATKEADLDYTAFGQCVIMPMWDSNNWRMLYQTFHIRDVAWECGWNGMIDTVYRKFKMTPRQAKARFGAKRLHPDLVKRCSDDKASQKDMEFMHIQVPNEKYMEGSSEEDEGKEYRSIYLDVEHKHEIENTGHNRRLYVIPRWKTVSGCDYAYSPAITAALPDARLMQAMTWTLLETGEKIARPPWLAVQSALRSDLNLVSDGVTFVSEEYDERLGEVLRPMFQDKGGLPFALNMKEDVRTTIDRALYLANMQLPVGGPQMTAFEIRERMEEFVRKTKPFFSPVEEEYNSELCEVTFAIMMEMDLFGDPRDFPASVQGKDLKFRFRSPVNEAEERGLAQMFGITLDMLRNAMDFDQNIVAEVNLPAAFRSSLAGAGAPSEWLADEDTVQKKREFMNQQAQRAQQMEAMERAAAAVGPENAAAAVVG